MPADLVPQIPLVRRLLEAFGVPCLEVPGFEADDVLGTLANQRPEAGRWLFGWGAITASLCWFCALGFGSRWLAPLFQTVTAWRVLDSLIALVMFSIAFYLAFAKLN